MHASAYSYFEWYISLTYQHKKKQKLTYHNNPYNVYDEAVGYMRMFLDRFSKLQVHIKFFNHDGLVNID